MIITELYDKYYPKQGFTTIRNCVRALVFKGEQCAMLHIKCEDGFGSRDHFEVPGGGIEYGETEVQAVHREIMEEMGMKVHIKRKLGTVIDRWNLLQRINAQHYYICDFESQEETNLTAYEQEVIKGLEWHTIAQWRVILSQPSIGINAMIHERELHVLAEFTKQEDIKQNIT